MRTFLAATLLFLTPMFLQAQATKEHTDRADPVEDFYNLDEMKIGLKGYDPVSYFEQQKPLKGDQEIELVYGGVTYYFSSEANRNLFLEDPTKYEPTYGGWCAWAMANQAYADINPEIYTLHGNRLHFFISRGAKARFDQMLESWEMKADVYWEMETKETPRSVKTAETSMP